MRSGVLLLLAGCQNLFGLHNLPAADGHATADAAHDVAIAWTDAPPDVAPIIDAARPLPALIQQSSNSAATSGLDVTLASPPTNGHLLVLVGGATCGLATISGGGVPVWSVAADSEVSPTETILYGITDGSTSTVHLVPKCTTDTWGLLSEWSGFPATTAVDGTNHLGQVTSVPGSLNIAVYPANAPDLLVFGVASYGALGSPSVAWTEMNRVTAGTVTQRTWYQLALTSGQHTADVSYDSDYDASIAGFRTQ